MKKYYNVMLSLVIVLSISACSNDKEERSSEQKAFDLFCDTFESLVARSDFDALDSESRAHRLDYQLKKIVGPNAVAYVAWSAIRNAVPKERSFLYKEAAASVGYSDWTCTVIERNADKVGSGTH